jgi:hypothetical protein
MLGVCLGERGVVMGLILISASALNKKANVASDTDVTKVLNGANVISVNLSHKCD